MNYINELTLSELELKLNENQVNNIGCFVGFTDLNRWKFFIYLGE